MCIAQLAHAAPACREQLVSDHVAPVLLAYLALRPVAQPVLQTLILLFSDPRVAQRMKSGELRPLIETVLTRDATLTPLAAAALIALLERQNLWADVTQLGGLDLLFMLAGCGNATVEQQAADLIVHLSKSRDPRVIEFLGRPRLAALLQSGSPRVQETLLSMFSLVPKVRSHTHTTHEDAAHLIHIDENLDTAY